ncbi:MAG: autotransporter outer membrane beta-barrel domain-containing protein [Firmicutes bacterium]|nr:autotransporter outer membrane beta-barrel domain-containing protein [Bacillota bacterium]
MKKTILILLVCLFILSLPTSAWGFFSPAVSEGHGVVNALIVSDSNFQIGGEYGFTNELAVLAVLGPQMKLGLKYELDPSLAILAGVADSSPFIGVNALAPLAKGFAGIGEVDFTVKDSKIVLLYNLGLKFNLSQNFDLRGGLLGDIGGGKSELLFGLGVGYKF